MTKQSLLPVGTERAVTRRESNPFTFLQHELDRLFDGFARNFPTISSTTATLPSMDVSETDKVLVSVREQVESGESFVIQV
jgi:HSP20 family protein